MLFELRDSIMLFEKITALTLREWYYLIVCIFTFIYKYTKLIVIVNVILY